MVICRAIAALAFFALSPALAAAQSTNSLFSTNVPNLLFCSPAPCVLPPLQASNDNLDAPIVADPANPQRLTLGGLTPNCGLGNLVAFNLTTDGGSSWSNPVCMTQVFGNGADYVTEGGPILGYDRTGIAYIGASYGNIGVQNSNPGFEGVETSSDGVNWSQPKPAVIRAHYLAEDCWMAVDTSPTSPLSNSTYVSCVVVGPVGNESQNQIVVSHSNDGGATWKQVNVAPVQNASIAEDFNTSIAIGKDGTAYVTWMYCYTMPSPCKNNKAYMLFSKSSDGGNTWSVPASAAAVQLNQIPNTNIGANNTPAIAVDNSKGSHAGNLYIVMYNWTGILLQVQVVRSTDVGNTWSKPVPVAPGITHDQFLPWISVSPTGLVGVSWLDRRNDPNNVNYQAFAGISADGGLSFQPNVQLTSGFSNPNEGTMNQGIGDYTGNTWDGTNYFVAAWMDNSNTDGTMVDVVGGIRLK